ncbi:gliding motility-associated C-terminal domain-containing protein [bacterium]|nr:gliding motility-associated C-terminal domain-containing protein [bacterium]MDB4088561.1 gliding motility-associated C-terminal domain-containing protein [Flavobacteriales bacterium]
MRNLLITILVSTLYLTSFTQPSNDNCSGAVEICMGNPKTGDTDGATAQVCATCADGPTVVGSACFDMDKTIWYTFTTNATGGNADIDISAINCSIGAGGISGTIYGAITPCNSASYTSVSNCIANSTADFTLNATGLTANTTYYILVASNSSSSCGFNISISGAAVLQPPSSIIISNNIDSGIICPEDFVTFTALTTNCTNPRVKWFIDGGQVEETTNGDAWVRNYFADGNVVTAELWCDCGGAVSNSNALTINVHPYITVSAGPYVNIPFGGSTQLNGSGGVTYSWSPENTLNDPKIANPIATPLSTTNYILTATSVEGCRFFSDVTVQVLDSVFVPNTFTPNGDGVNDTWQIMLIDNFPKAEVTVFDRWGQIVFKTIGYPTSARWDGTRNGKALPASTYYYTISLSIDSQEERLKTGSVTIIY